MSVPTLCFVARSIGEISETWMWRQIVGFTRVRPHVLTWQYIHRDLFPMGDVPMHIQPEAACWPEETSGLARRMHRLRNLPGRDFFATTRREYATITHALREIRPDVMLCQYGMIGLRMLPVARQLAIPLVVHFHGSDLASTLENPWYRWSITSALPRFDAIVVVNTKQRDWIVRQGVEPANVHVIPCGVPTEEGAERPPKERNATAPQFIVVSRLVKLKGIDVSIRAFAAVVKEIPQARLVVVGEGPEREELDALVDDMGLRASVRFTGWLSHDDVRQELRQSDVFLQHSLVPEGWPVSVAEASAMGLPVVVTPCGGLSEQVVDGVTGFMVPMRDVRCMQESMLRLARDPDLRERMGMAGRMRMTQEFSVRRQIGRLEDVLLDCADLLSVSSVADSVESR